jgi:hypothetical protein
MDLTGLFHFKVHIEGYSGLNGPFQGYICQNFGHKALFSTLTPKCVKCGENLFFSDCQKHKQNPHKCANCNKQHLSILTGCEARTKYIQGSHLASAKHANINKQYVPFLTDHKFPSLTMPSSSLTGITSKSQIRISHTLGKIDQYVPQINHRNDENYLSELIKEITSIMKGCNTRLFLH